MGRARKCVGRGFGLPVRAPLSVVVTWLPGPGCLGGRRKCRWLPSVVVLDAKSRVAGWGRRLEEDIMTWWWLSKSRVAMYGIREKRQQATRLPGEDWRA